MTLESMPTLTIGRLARAADVGVETVRYYQERRLLPVPSRVGSYRQYPTTLVERIRFIKRAQELGFTLKEVASLLELNDGTDRERIRAITRDRMAQIQAKLADLKRMHQVLDHLVQECEKTGSDSHCPIIETLASDTHHH
jgi:Hg(II)-responsive transcriptional regulator